MLILILALLLATVALAPLAARLLGRNAGWALSVPLLASAVLAAVTYVPSSSGAPHTESLAWLPSLGANLTVRIDGLSLVFLMLVLLIGAGVLIYSTRYLGKGRPSSFYFYISGFAAAMTLLVLTDDLMVFYVAWELTTFCSFFLIADAGEKGRQPAIRTLLVTVFGGLLLLTATVIMAVTTSSMRISEILVDPVWADRPGLTAIVAALLAGAAFTKSAQFPFQAWLPDSMVAIAPVSAYLHAAAMVKAGIYLILRYTPMLGEVTVWNVLLISVGLFTALFGAMTAIRRDDLKELLAYSTMSQLGLLVAVVGIGTPTAVAAAITHTIAHAVFKAALFMSVGIVEHETGTRSYAQLRTMRLNMPVTKAIVVVSALSMAGVPLFFGFVSKEYLLQAGVAAEFPPSAVVLIVAAITVTSMFTFAYSLRYIIGVFGGTKKTLEKVDDPVRVGEAAPTFWLVPALLSITTIVFGLLPWLLENPVADASSAAAGQPYEPGLALWHGFTVPLGLSALIIAVGALLVAYSGQVGQALRTYRAPIRGVDAVEYLRQGTIDLGAALVTGPSGTTSMRRHLAAPMIGLLVIAVVAAVTLTDIPDVVADRSRPLDWIFVLIVALGVAAAVSAKSRLTVVVVISIAGFGVTLWFFSLGAADVATTQLTVEILTVVILVLILRRLPDRFTPDTQAAKVSSIALAVAMGVAAMLAVLALTGRREKSDAAEYYLREGENVTGGSNIVNTILVEFRALDTLGELTVLGFAGIGIYTLLKSRPLLPARPTLMDEASPVRSALANSVFLRVTTRVIGPLIIVISVLLFFRGHNETGGGFVAALVGAAGFGLLYLSAPTDRAAKVKWPFLALIGAGVAVGAGTGLVGYLAGSFLEPIQFEVFGLAQTTSLVFDLGVYLAVVGMVLTAINMLGGVQDPGSPDAPLEREPEDHEPDPLDTAPVSGGTTAATASTVSGTEGIDR